MDVLTVRFAEDADTLRVILYGEIDHHSAKAVREETDRRIAESRAKKVCLDLKNVGFMDSSGLGLILGRYTKVKEYGGELVLLDPGKSTERVLRLAGTEKIIPIIRTTEGNG